jgi:drug/metabolite transporter (DMT)-like permease
MKQENPPQTMRLPHEDAALARNHVSQLQVGSRYVLLILIWSSTPLAVVWSIRELHPMWALGARFVLASLLAYVVLICLKMPLRWDKKAIHSYIAGSLSLLGAMLFTYLAAAYLASGLISLIYGLSPLIAGIFTVFLFKQQRLFAEQWAGMIVAFIGLLFICLTGERAFIQPIGVFLILVALLCYVGSMFWVKAIQAKLQPMVQTTGSLLVSALGMLPVLLFFKDDMPTAWPDAKSIGAIIYTVLIASIVAMFLYFDLVERLSPSTVALTTVLTPVLALIWGALFNHEHIGPNIIVGVVIILLGLIFYFIRDWQQQYRLKAASK